VTTRIAENCTQQGLAAMRVDELICWFVLSIYFCFIGQLAHFNSAQTASPERFDFEKLLLFY